jgi:hypothetical protein
MRGTTTTKKTKRLGLPAPQAGGPPTGGVADRKPALVDDKTRLPDAAVACLLAALVLVTLLATRPLAGVPLNDDFSYARSTQALAEQGRIAYNGWGSPLLWPQLAYGALVITLFGFSYAALGATGVVLAGLCAAVMYLVARACDVSPLWSALATGALTLNPIFLGVAPTFMTDVPSLLLLLLSLLALVRALTGAADGQVRIDRRRFVLAVVLGIVAGSNRQISWIAFSGALLTLLVLAPGERRLVLPAAGATLAVTALLTLWFNRQPYTIPADITTGLLFLIGYTNIAFMFIYKFLNMLGLFLLPLALPAAGRRLLRGPAFLALIVLCLIPVFYPFGTTLNLLNGDYRLTVYGQYFTSAGIVVGGVHGFEKRPPLFGPAVARALVVLGAVGLALAVALVSDWLKSVRQTPRSARSVPQIAVCLLLAVSLLQLLVSLAWYAQMNVFDRYLLFLLPGLYVLFAARAQESGRLAAGAGLALVLILWGVGFASTQEYMGYTRARAALYSYLLRQGVRPREINGGFELNADTQVQAEGHINNPQVVNPPGAYRDGATARYVTYRPELFPAIDARYLLSTDPNPDPSLVLPTPVHSATYASPLFPPVRRTMYIYRTRRGSGD